MLIGVFDSGVGGLNILQQCVKVMPYAKYIYYGDNKNAPYGNLSKNEIYKNTKKVFNYFLRKKVNKVIIACNTITMNCIDCLRLEYPFEIIGIKPQIENAIASLKQKVGKVLVLTTKATACSNAFKRQLSIIKNEKSDIEIDVFSPTELVTEIEKEIFDLSKIDLKKHFVFDNYIAVILGCTHYAYLSNSISKFFNCRVFTQNIGRDFHFLATEIKNAQKCGVSFVKAGKKKNLKVFKKYFLC